MPSKVLITGLGAVTGFGYGVQPLWEGLCAGRSALRPIRRFDASGLRCRVGAEAVGFAARDHVPKHYRKAVKVMARDIELAVGAAKSAVEDGGLITRAIDPEGTPTYAPERVGCQIGAGLIAAEVEELAMAMATATDEEGRISYERWGVEGMENLTPLWLLKYLPNMLSCHVTILHDARGPSNTITCSEASGLLSIGESLRVIQRGDADLCFSGGAECKVNHMGMLRMDFAGRLAPTPDVAPPGADDAPVDEARFASLVRPYDPGTSGGLLGEGGGIVLLELGEAAEERGARAYAELAGFGAGQSPRSDDPARRSEGLRAAIENALADAGVGADSIDAIVPHGAGVPAVDAEEAAALRAVFGSRLAGIPLVTATPNVGDTMAGLGGVACCIGAMCLSEQRLPARLNAGAPADGLRAGAAPARAANLRHVLVCTNALGGQNASVVLRAAG